MNKVLIVTGGSRGIGERARQEETIHLMANVLSFPAEPNG